MDNRPYKEASKDAASAVASLRESTEANEIESLRTALAASREEIKALVIERDREHEECEQFKQRAIDAEMGESQTNHRMGGKLIELDRERAARDKLEQTIKAIRLVTTSEENWVVALRDIRRMCDSIKAEGDG